jgi:membrane-associated phospholipid phosphatase
MPSWLAGSLKGAVTPADAMGMSAAMTEFLREAAHWEAFVLQALETVRWGPLTVVFLLASAWWVKAPLFVAIGAAGDVRARRHFPCAAATAAVGTFAAGALSMALKGSFDRPRPEFSGVGVDPAISTPSDPSFPSGHTLTAFAAAAVIASYHPRLRWPVLALAALVGFSRMYLGVHFWLDVVAGAALGLAVGYAVAALAKRLSPVGPRVPAPDTVVPRRRPRRSRGAARTSPGR